MTDPSLALVGRIRDLARAGCEPEDDARLLERFILSREHDAFVALMRRHGPMVFGVCRRVLGNPHDAEDAFQATFLVLARKAGALTNRSCVAGWLCRVAHHAALRARTREDRRRRRERATAKVPEREVDSLGERESWQALHDELRRLPDRLHAPLVLCYLEGQTYEEAARRLRWPLGTLKKRLTQARAVLRRRLLRRGLGLPPLSGALACPAELLRMPGADAPAVHTLAEEVMRSTLTIRLKAAAALLAVAGALAVGAALMARPGPPAALRPKRDIAQAPAPGNAPRRILLAGSAATRDFQFLRALLEREAEKRRVRLTTHLQTVGGRAAPGVLTRFPDRLRPVGYPGTKEHDEPYNLNEYDLIVAFDLDWSRPSPEALVLLQSWVEKRGGGLVLVAGPVHTPALGKPDAVKGVLGPILQLCPVTPLATPRKAPPDQPVRLRFAKGAANLPFLKLDGAGKDPLGGWDAFYAEDKGNRKLQRGFYGYQPAKAGRMGAQVVLTFADPREKGPAPYLVVGPRGRGRVVWLGSGETWRLRQYREAWYERFWMELARYAAPGTHPAPDAKE
jgi:RNA polymerase sigma factor (sigma-70 family)